MQRNQHSRRAFLRGTGALAGGTLFRAGVPGMAALAQAACSARDEAAAYENLGSDEAREIIAIAARILPTTDTPGATEAGAVYFFDQALGGLVPRAADSFRTGLANFEAGIRDRFPGAERFSDLAAADQDAWLASAEDTPFFADARFLTLAGVFAMRKYGGNRDDIGWKLAGMDGPPHAWSHPFGDYDAEQTEETTGGA
jgi:gluconate 2-dehydrogenase gamma chain